MKTCKGTVIFVIVQTNAQFFGHRFAQLRQEYYLCPENEFYSSSYEQVLFITIVSG